MKLSKHQNKIKDYLQSGFNLYMFNVGYVLIEQNTQDIIMKPRKSTIKALASKGIIFFRGVNNSYGLTKLGKE